jgi:hypothetical protein
MPRFYFDIFDGERLWTDDEGSDHADLDAARHEPIDTLTNMSRETFPLNGPSSLSVDIRPDGRPPVIRIVITLSLQHL